MIKGDILELEIESIGGEGKTVARRDGMVFFVENAVPGDVVHARVWKIKKNYCEARAVELVKPSRWRITPRCKHFGICGGCKWQNLEYGAQLDQKRRGVKDAFARIGGFPDLEVPPVIGCDEPFYYRNKMEFTFSRRKWLTDAEMGTEFPPETVALGLHIPERFDKVLDIEECFLQSEVSAAICNAVREITRGWGLSVYSTKTHEGYLRHLTIRQSKRSNQLMVNLVTTTDWPEAMTNLTNLLTSHFPEITTIVNNITDRKSMVAFGDSEKIYFGEGFITEQLGRCTFRISANSFFQTNTLQAEKLYETAKNFAELKPTDVLYDLYSGTGSIAIYMSDAVERVIGIESVESSVRDAGKNAEFNGAKNCTFLLGDLKDRLTKDRSWLDEHPRPNVIITDPPRSGMHEKVVDEIIKLAPEKIVYVSCNVATQARDARILADGGYELLKVQPVDMFPHTDHVEDVALLVRRS
jgi:23S rRNA (uracil1939-C5)-methyltransferase